MSSHELLAIEPTTYRRWVEQLRYHGPRDVLGRLQSPEAVARLKPGQRSVGDIAVVPISGFISQKPTIFSELFGGTSTEGLVATIRGAVKEPSIGAVVLDVDSPGGSVFGLTEAAAAIRDLRGVKPIVSVGNPIMASAAYYLAAQADEVVATPSALVGSVGTIAVVVDPTEALEKQGIKVEVFTYGERKAEMMPPLDDVGRDAIQAQVDQFGAMFEADVARGRGVSRKEVRGRYGRGAMFMADDALSTGLVDRVGTLESVVGEIAAGRRPKARMRAEEQVRLASWRLRLGLTNFDSGY